MLADVTPTPAAHERPGSQAVLVTGVGGVVGPCLCALLAARGLPFGTLGRSGAQPSGSYIAADLSQPHSLVFEGRFEVLIHMAPLWLLPDNIGRMTAAGVRRIWTPFFAMAS